MPLIRGSSNHFDTTLMVPWLPDGRTVVVPGRGEFFIRHFVHPDPCAPTVLLLHGWTATTDLQFFTAYKQIAEKYSFIGIDHRGHGRGLRSSRPFLLEDCADDVAAVLGMLGITRVIAVGYSMGGPIGMLLARRYLHLVQAMVLQATALEWSSTRRERIQWRIARIAAPALRHLSSPRFVGASVRNIVDSKSELFGYLDWIVGEIRRDDPWAIDQAGQALGRFDAKPWIHELKVPIVIVVTTKDKLVAPERQYRLAEAVQAHIVPLEGDHTVTLVSPQRYSTATCIAIDYALQHSSQ